MKPYIKMFTSKVTDTLLIKDITIAVLIVALILSNNLFIFNGFFQWILSVPVLVFCLVGLLFFIDNIKVVKLERVLLMNIDEQINSEKEDITKDCEKEGATNEFNNIDRCI